MIPLGIIYIPIKISTPLNVHATGQYLLSSFFDIFPELSMDGGNTWSASVSGPATVHVRMPPPIPVAVLCPVDMTVPATGPGGAVVTFTPGASGGCGGAVTIIASPPSGSLFPIGTTRSEERRVGKEGRSRWSPY